MRRAAHNLIKTTVDCVCGNELEHQSHGSVKLEARASKGRSLCEGMCENRNVPQQMSEFIAIINCCYCVLSRCFLLKSTQKF